MLQVKGSSSELTTNNEAVLLFLTIINLSVNKPTPSEYAAIFGLAYQLFSSAILFSVLNLNDFPPSTNSKWRGRKGGRIGKAQGEARGLSLGKPVLSIKVTHYRHRSCVHQCKWNHLCHRSGLAGGPGLAMLSAGLGHVLQLSFKGKRA